MVSAVQPKANCPQVIVSYESTLQARVTALALGVIAAAVVYAAMQPPGLAILLYSVILVTTFALVFNKNKTAYVNEDRSHIIMNENLTYDYPVFSNRSERSFSPILPNLARLRDPAPVPRTQYPSLFPIYQGNESPRVPVGRTDPLPTYRNQTRTRVETEGERVPVGLSKPPRNPLERERVPVEER